MRSTTIGLLQWRWSRKRGKWGLYVFLYILLLSRYQRMAAAVFLVEHKKISLSVKQGGGEVTIGLRIIYSCAVQVEGSWYHLERGDEIDRVTRIGGILTLIIDFSRNVSWRCSRITLMIWKQKWISRRVSVIFFFNYFRRDDVFKDQSELQRPSTKNSRRFRGPPTSRRWS